MMQALGLRGAGGRRIRFVRARLWLHRHFFSKRHFWVKSLSPLVIGAWCFECGTVKGHEYPCRTEHRLRQTCEPFGDYPNCAEVLSALMFVHHPGEVDYRMCAWCEAQVRSNLSPVLYFDTDESIEFDRSES